MTVPNVQWIVLLDAVGTVIGPARSVFATYLAHGINFGSQLTLDDVKTRFLAARQNVFATGVSDSKGDLTFPSCEDIEKQLWFDLVNQVFTDVPNVKELFESLWNFYAQPGNWMVYDDVSECLANFSQMGAKIGLASNFDSRLSPIVLSFLELTRLDWVFYSSLVGYRKPDRRFYETIASRVAREIGPDVTPRFLMVGDHLANDVVTPLALGWSSILLDRHDANLCEVSIRSLSELPAWFAANSG